jgi:predicted ABC-type ATPase
MANEKRIFIIAGPNGAGKTTFAVEFLPREADCPDFINVDLSAAPCRSSNSSKMMVDITLASEYEVSTTTR